MIFKIWHLWCLVSAMTLVIITGNYALSAIKHSPKYKVGDCVVQYIREIEDRESWEPAKNNIIGLFKVLEVGKKKYHLNIYLPDDFITPVEDSEYFNRLDTLGSLGKSVECDDTLKMLRLRKD